MSSCNFGTLASFARLPMSDVVVRSSVKSGSMPMVSTGTGEVGVGGVIMMEVLNCESETVKETGRRAKDDMG